MLTHILNYCLIAFSAILVVLCFVNRRTKFVIATRNVATAAVFITTALSISASTGLI